MEKRKTVSFKLKKWLLIIFCFITMIFTIVAGYLGLIFTNKVIEEYKSFLEPTYGLDISHDTLKIMTRIYIIIFAAINMVFHLFGVIGAFKKHYCLLMTFAIYMTVHSFASILLVFYSKTLWISAVISCSITLIAYALAIDVFKTGYQKLIDLSLYAEFAKPKQFIVPMQSTANGNGHDMSVYSEQSTKQPQVMLPMQKSNGHAAHHTPNYRSFQYRVRHLS